MTVTLVLGGARSGKSRYAETIADKFLEQKQGGERIYIATAQAFDEEMTARIKTHKEQRGMGWSTIEEPFELPATLQQNRAEGRLLLVDCLTLWLSNLLLAERECETAVDALVTVLAEGKGDVLLVSNEVGLSVVPENRLARRFRDIQGSANQKIAEVSDRVVFVAAGLPIILKDRHAI